MDITKTITHLGLCAGYGGIELGLKRVLPALRTVALCEIEAFAIANLVAKMEAGLMDPAPIWTNLKTFPWESFRDRVDILTGGYPCQPFSAAGKRLGTEDPRHLWPHIASGIQVLQPKICFFENVEGHISLGLRDVLRELGELGYRATWGIFSAAEIGLPHQRKRVFILAHRNDTGLERYWRPVAEYDSQGRQGTDGHAWPSRPGQPQHAWEPPRVVGNPNSDRRECDVPRDAPQQDSDRQNNGISSETNSMGNTTDTGWQRSRREDDPRWQMQRSSEPDGSQSDREMESGQRQAQPALGGDADGPASGLDYAELCVSCDNRTDELRLLGNGVVPATAALAFLTLKGALERIRDFKFGWRGTNAHEDVEKLQKIAREALK